MSEWNLQHSPGKQEIVCYFPYLEGLMQVIAWLPMFSYFALQYAIKKVQVNQKGLKL